MENDSRLMRVWRRIMMIVLGFLAAGMLLFALGLSGGCSRKVVYIPTESAMLRVDTLREISARVDSIWVKDSVSLRTSGDTVFLERWRDRYKYVGRVDTVYKARVDSIRVAEPFPVEVVKEVVAPVSAWRKILSWIGGGALVGVLFILLWHFWLGRRFR